MLLELQIRDFALIDKLRIEFGQGLNILTGETGAGKSIIIDSVNFVLGERSSKEIIRTGTDKTIVEAVFQNAVCDELLNIMNDYGIDLDEEVIVLSRELSQSGKGICRINGKIVTTSVLKTIGNYLIDIHGQHEHQSLLDDNSHIELLDMFGSSSISILRSEVKELYTKISYTRQELSKIVGNDRERQRRIDLLSFQINEIDSTKLEIGEEDELLKQKNILKNSGKLFSTLSNSYSSLYEGLENESIYDRIGYILGELQNITGLDDKLQIIYKPIEEAYYLIEGAITDIREYKDKIDFNPDIIDEVESRLDIINKLKRKYGSTIREVLEYKESASKELEEILNSEQRIKDLELEIKEYTKKIYSKSKELSDLRKSTAKKLESDIVNELRFLGMEKSKFIISFDLIQKDGGISFDEKGIDIVRFMISTNIGEPEKPLSKIASGGEISRIMLAIKTVLANTDRIPTLIFDEIDTGISGKAAQAVAEKLGQISNSHQIICVTHLPQIASMGDIHFYIQKVLKEEKTVVNVETLDKNNKIREIARMLGGAKLTDLTIKHAEEMLYLSQSMKKPINM